MDFTADERQLFVDLVQNYKEERGTKRIHTETVKSLLTTRPKILKKFLALNKHPLLRMRIALGEEPLIGRCALCNAVLEKCEPSGKRRLYCSSKCAGANNSTKEKRLATNLDKYGSAFPIQNSKIKRKIHQTNLSRYGTKTPFESDSIKRKIKRTLKKKYGVENPSQSPHIQVKKLESGYNTSKIALANGLLALVQGYEEKAIRYLESKGHRPIPWSLLKIGIRYLDKGEERTYYPDLLCKYTLYEVKSSWTLLQSKKVWLNIKNKARACLNSSFGFKLLLVQRNGKVRSVDILSMTYKEALLRFSGT